MVHITSSLINTYRKRNTNDEYYKLSKHYEKVRLTEKYVTWLRRDEKQTERHIATNNVVETISR